MKKFNPEQFIKQTEKALSNLDKYFAKNKFPKCTGSLYKKNVKTNNCEMCFLGVTAFGAGYSLHGIKSNSIDYSNILLKTGFPKMLIEENYEVGKNTNPRNLPDSIVHLNDVRLWTFTQTLNWVKKSVRAKANAIVRAYRANEKFLAQTEKGLANIERAIKNNKFEETTGSLYIKGEYRPCGVCFLGAVGVGNGISVKNLALIDQSYHKYDGYVKILVKTGLPKDLIQSEYAADGSNYDLKGLIIHFNDSSHMPFEDTLKEVRKMVTQKAKEIVRAKQYGYLSVP